MKNTFYLYSTLFMVLLTAIGVIPMAYGKDGRGGRAGSFFAGVALGGAAAAVASSAYGSTCFCNGPYGPYACPCVYGVPAPYPYAYPYGPAYGWYDW